MRIKAKNLVLIALIALAFSACDKTKYFEPKSVNKSVSGSFNFPYTLSAGIVESRREGAILGDGKLLTKNGVVDIKLAKNDKYFATDGARLVLQDNCKNLKIANIADGEIVKIPTSNCLASANIYANKIAALYTDNTIALLDIPAQSEQILDIFPKAIAATNLVARPEFVGKLVIFPTLNGKVAIYDLNTQKQVRDIAVGSEKFFNNISYLKVLDDGRIIAATNRRISVVYGTQVNNFDADLRDVIYANNAIFALTNNGEIIKFDLNLKRLNSVKLPFATFSGVVVSQEKLYTSERNGFLIELDTQSFEYKIWKNSHADSAVFYSDKVLYLGRHFAEF